MTFSAIADKLCAMKRKLSTAMHENKEVTGVSSFIICFSFFASCLYSLDICDGKVLHFMYVLMMYDGDNNAHKKPSN